MHVFIHQAIVTAVLHRTVQTLLGVEHLGGTAVRHFPNWPVSSSCRAVSPRQRRPDVERVERADVMAERSPDRCYDSLILSVEDVLSQDVRFLSRLLKRCLESSREPIAYSNAGVHERFHAGPRGCCVSLAALSGEFVFSGSATPGGSPPKQAAGEQWGHDIAVASWQSPDPLALHAPLSSCWLPSRRQTWMKRYELQVRHTYTYTKAERTMSS